MVGDVPWVETPSLSFTARHEASQSDDALAVLEDLEQHRARLEQLLPRVPANVTVILHDSPVQLYFASPLLLLTRRLASRAGRRYMVGWYRSGEVHTLSGPALREPWLAEGAAQHFAGQVQFMRAAIATRLREGQVRFPPGRRDAGLLGGTVFDLLHRERGERACVRLATHPYGSTRDALEDSFGRSLSDTAHGWRQHLERLSTPEPGVEPVGRLA